MEQTGLTENFHAFLNEQEKGFSMNFNLLQLFGSNEVSLQIKGQSTIDHKKGKHFLLIT